MSNNSAIPRRAAAGSGSARGLGASLLLCAGHAGRAGLACGDWLGQRKPREGQASPFLHLLFINEVYLICRLPRGKNNTLEPQMSVSGGLRGFSHLNDILGR